MRKTPHKIAAAILLLIILASIRINIGDRNANAETTILDDGRIKLDVSVRGTYLHAEQYRDVNNDGSLDPPGGGPVEPPEIVDLQAYGFKPGDKMYIVFSTKWDDWQLWDPSRTSYQQLNTVNGSLIGVFSTSSDLAPIEQLNRVPGAIDAGADIVTVKTAFNREPTDIPEDFPIFPGTDFSIKVPPNARYLFLCLNDGYYPDCMGTCTVKLDKDSDGDGLWDSWEIKGIDVDNDETIDLKLVGADPKHKDIYVEVDFMKGHMPDKGALNEVEDAFYDAPVENPDRSWGIELHVEVDYEDSVPHQDVVYDWGDFISIKNVHFGTPVQRTDPSKAKVLEAKKMAYHYCLFAHQYAEFNNVTEKWDLTTSSGKGNCPGSEFFVSLGAWKGGVGSSDEQAATFMHELGHNLGLDHGGGDDTNYKPNYLSIMNYLFQMRDNNPSRPLDYSRYQLPDLNEKNLNETKGIFGGPNYVPDWLDTVYSMPPKNKPMLSFAAWPIDWNGNKKIDNVTVQANPNNYPQWDYTSPNNEPLHGYNDWENLILNFRDMAGTGGGAETVIPDSEITWETVQAMQEEAKLRHEVSAANLSAPPGTIDQTGFNVNVTLANLGGNPEAFNVTVYANATTIASKALELSGSNVTTLIIPCNSTGLKMGNYTLSAYVNPVVNETCTADNTITGSVITVVDKTPPMVTISSPSSGSEVKSSTVTVTWMGSDVNSGIAGFEVQLDGGSWTNVGTVMSRGLTGLSDGSHTVEVRATDMGGNTKVATVNFTANTSSWLLPVVAVGGLVVIAAIVIFLRRKREK